MNQKSVFQFGNEYQCTQFNNTQLNYSGLTVKRNGELIGEIVGLDIPDIDDEDENIKFDDEVINWIVDNE